jgi:protein-S-isoprenylcysteine O-methyltransferase Ste14
MGEFWFKIVFVLIFSSLSVIRIICKRRAGAAQEGLFPKQEGFLGNGIRTVLGVPLFGMLGFYLVLPDTLPQTYISVPLFARFAGITGGICALIVIGLSHKALGRNYSSTVVLKKNHRLVTGGVYRFVRHPMYSAYLLLFISAFLVSENWVIGVTGSGIILSLMTLRLRLEETLLHERFGLEYINYVQRAGRFLPLVKRGVKRLPYPNRQRVQAGGGGSAC